MTAILRLWKLVQPRPINYDWLLSMALRVGLGSFTAIVYVSFGIGFGTQVGRWNAAEAAYALGLMLPVFIIFETIMAWLAMGGLEYVPAEAEELAERLSDLDEADAAKVSAYIDYLLEHRSD